MNRFYINVGQKNVKPRCVKREYQLFVDQLCIVYMHIGPVGFPDLFFASDIYIGLYDPISVADPGFGVGGTLF